MMVFLILKIKKIILKKGLKIIAIFLEKTRNAWNLICHPKQINREIIHGKVLHFL
jgi:hypothetical protein